MRFHSLLMMVAFLGTQTAFGYVCSKVSENQVAQLSCPSGQTISSIGFASYGTPTGSCGSYKVSSCNASSSKSVVQSACIGKASCQVNASNSLFGDPCSGIGKTLAMQANCAAPVPTSVCAKATENQVAQISCPSGKVVSSVTFASYGTPTGSCGSYKVSSCNASISKSVVKSACLGKASCQVTATNGVFGDPCPGAYKSLDVQVACSAPSPKPSPSPSPSPRPTPTQTPIPSVGSNVVPPSSISIPAQTLALPSSIANGASASNPTIVSLQCGQVYRGTLDLSYKSYVTVNVAGTCGKPTIIPSSNSQIGINAVGASNIKISGIKIQSASQGINVNNANTVSIDNTDILNSSNSGIFCSGANGMTVSNSSISNTAVTGIDSLGAINNSIITNTTVVNTSTNGSSGSGGVGIYFYNGTNNRIDHVTVSNSAYHGIVSLETSNSYVTNSLAQNSCTGPDKDCGAIYTGQKVTPHYSLGLTIDKNKVVTSGGNGIYLDDFSNGVTVTNNEVTGCQAGLSMHNAFNNQINHNTIYSNSAAHVHMGQDTGTMHDNVFTYNTMTSTNGEYAYNLEAGTNLSTFGSYNYNTYKSNNVNLFGRLWQGGSYPGIDASYSAWKSTYMPGQDIHSTMNGAN